MDDGGGGIIAVLFLIVYFALIIGVLAGVWKVHVKAGQPGWACIIPIYNMIVMLQIAGKPLWWILLMFVPFVNFIVIIFVFVAVAENFGKGAGFGVGLALLGFIFFPILGFGDAQYQGVKPA